MKSVTLATLIAEVRSRADIESQTARHTDTQLIWWINRAWQMLRLKLTKDGVTPMFLKWSTPAAMTAGVKAGYSFGELSLPADAAEVFAIDVTISGNEIQSLLPCDLGQRNEYRNQFGEATGIPRTFWVEDVGLESTTTLSQGHIALLPAPDRAYTYSIGYVPHWVDITNTTYVFNSVANYDEWVIWDVVQTVAARDNDMQGTASIAFAKQQAVWNDLVSSSRIQRVGPVARVDVARQMRSQARRRFV
jgi:hypothetical protein